MKFVVAGILMLLVSCSSELKKPVAPDDLISRDSMVIVMRDMVVLESYIDVQYQGVQNYHKLVKKSGNLLLKKYHITPERYDKSYDYYVGHQAELQSIYSAVLDSLNKETNKMRAKGVNSGQISEKSRSLLPFRQKKI